MPGDPFPGMVRCFCVRLALLSVVKDHAMSLNYLPELISLFPLAAAFVLIYRERKWFKSLTLLGAGVVLLFVARLCDVLMQIPSSSVADLLRVPRPLMDQVLNSVSDVADTAAVFLIVLGFVRTIRYERQKEERIKTLELLLPICAWCKRFRTDSGEWQPIELYLQTKGASLTHGICPDCTPKVFGSPGKHG
jgi:hypothetical protein